MTTNEWELKAEPMDYYGYTHNVCGVVHKDGGTIEFDYL